ncbi:unnamed protein product [Durusdinium trenchii]|uniref:Uncharacterized protein n=1 Tax=Durusdinium trenchii TaxID=1381693 RepID=A0ABP0NVX7_9DINO
MALSGFFKAPPGPVGKKIAIHAHVSACFEDGNFVVRIDEENIHSEDKEDSDPFEDGSLWEQEYKGTIQMEGSQFQLLVTESTRNGQFHGLEPPEVLLGEKCEESGHVKLQLPFGGCSDAEEPPLIWLTLREAERPEGF